MSDAVKEPGYKREPITDIKHARALIDLLQSKLDRVEHECFMAKVRAYDAQHQNQVALPREDALLIAKAQIVSYEMELEQLRQRNKYLTKRADKLKNIEA